MSVYLFPGQGSQHLKMGEELFSKYPMLVRQADELLGYSIASLCINDPLSQLNNTAFTQPALFVVNALSYLNFKEQNQSSKPDYVLGHSLGEYNALWAAGVFDFATGVQLVQKRGTLMAEASDGKMAAVIGLTTDQVIAVLATSALQGLSIANYNSYLQHVVSGPRHLIDAAKSYFINAGAIMYHSLAVTGAFHSPFMKKARAEFFNYLNTFSFNALQIPVIANINAKPYEEEAIKNTLALHIEHPVHWLHSIQYLLGKGETHFEEIGPGRVLKNLLMRIQKGQ